VSPLSLARGRLVLRVHVQPGAREDGPAGLHDGRLKLRIAAPPVDGAANERVVEVVARLFGLRRGDVELVGGATSRRKDLVLTGLGLEVAQRRLDALEPPRAPDARR
jgi:uncharacterized protein (TIGR00251 family)